MSSERVLITGGAGFIGSNLALSLLERGHDVTVIDALIPECGGSRKNLEPRIKDLRFIEADVRDERALHSAVEGRDWVFHLAGQTGHQLSMNQPALDLELNAKSAISVLEACRKLNPTTKVVYTSTRQVYGVPKSLPVTEGHSTEPIDTNGIHKLAVEQYLSLYGKVYGLRAVSLRLTNTYGPRQCLKSPDHGFVPWFVHLALENRPIQLYGGGAQVRDFTYVDDAVEALILSAKTSACDGKALNVGGERASLEKLATLLVAAAGQGRIEKIPFPAERKKIDIGDYYGSFDELQRLTGWSPRAGLEEGLKRTVAFYSRQDDK